MILFLHVQNFMDKLPLNIGLCNSFYNCTIMTWLLQSENEFQLIINFFIFVSISSYNDILGCKLSLIKKFSYKILHPP
jgi:hypothetical protein